MFIRLALDCVLSRWPVGICEYVDDIAIRAAGTEKYLCKLLPSATRELCELLRGTFGLDVSPNGRSIPVGTRVSF